MSHWFRWVHPIGNPTAQVRFLGWPVTRMPLIWSGQGRKVSVFKLVSFGRHAAGHLSRHGYVLRRHGPVMHDLRLRSRWPIAMINMSASNGR